MARKPKVTKLDAAMIAIQHAATHGITAAGAPEVHDPRTDGTWSVFVPDGFNRDPAGTIIIVDQNTGEAHLFPGL